MTDVSSSSPGDNPETQFTETSRGSTRREVLRQIGSTFAAGMLGLNATASAQSSGSADSAFGEGNVAPRAGIRRRMARVTELGALRLQSRQRVSPHQSLSGPERFGRVYAVVSRRDSIRQGLRQLPRNQSNLFTRERFHPSQRHEGASHLRNYHGH
jgi:hypothetical protein